MTKIIYYRKCLKGRAHIEQGKPCQDYCQVKRINRNWIVAGIADGVGSASKAEIGSKIAVESAINFIDNTFNNFKKKKNYLRLLQDAFENALISISQLSKSESDKINNYDTTLTIALYNGNNMYFGHSGDGGIIAISDDGDYIRVTEQQKGEFYNSVLPLRAGKEIWQFGHKSNISSLLLATDGVYDGLLCPNLLKLNDNQIYVHLIKDFIDLNFISLRSKYVKDFEEEIETFFRDDNCSYISDDMTIVGIINSNKIPKMKDEMYYLEPDWKNLQNEINNKLYKKESN